MGSLCGWRCWLWCWEKLSRREVCVRLLGPFRFYLDPNRPLIDAKYDLGRGIAEVELLGVG